MKYQIVYITFTLLRFYDITLSVDNIAVKIKGESALETAQKLAHKYGYLKVAKIGDLEQYFSFENRVKDYRVKRDFNNISEEKDIEWMEIQYPKQRMKRGATEYDRFNDPMFKQQWYLINSNRDNKLDVNILPVWQKGFTGRGVVVTILDDGIEYNHTDLMGNYEPNASWDINDDDSDPFPRYDAYDENKHGTRCAGEVAAAANNGFCGVGVAFECRIGGVRMLDGHVTDKVEAASLSLNPQYIDIYSSSWGPNDDGKTIEGPGVLASAAFLNGILKGRNGLGSIYVWASGNGGHHDDDCNCDGYANNIYTLSISSTSDQGDVPWYSETCASTLASTLSSGTYLQRRIITTDLHNTCTTNHTGTSASAPIAAGVFALLLQANRNLTWRDVQHLTVYTSNWIIFESSGNWNLNSIGLHFHQKFGFGLLDAQKLIEWATAIEWTTCPTKYTCNVDSNILPRIITSGVEMDIIIYVDGCKNSLTEINYIEHTQITISLDHNRRGDISIDIISPVGTLSPVLDKRNEDDSSSGFNNWTMTTVHFWGENPFGTWIIRFKDNANSTTINHGLVKSCILTLHGTKDISYYHTEHIRLTKSKRENMNHHTIEKVKKNHIPKMMLSSTKFIREHNRRYKMMQEYLDYLKYVQYQDYIYKYTEYLKKVKEIQKKYWISRITRFGYI